MQHEITIGGTLERNGKNFERTLIAAWQWFFSSAVDVELEMLINMSILAKLVCVCLFVCLVGLRENVLLVLSGEK